MVRKSSKKSLFPRHRSYLFVGLAVTVGLVIGLVIVKYSLVIPPAQVARVAQTISTPAVSLQIQSATEVASRELFSGQTIPGEKGLVIKLRVENKTSTTQPFLPVNQVFLKSRDGKLYQMRPVSGLSSPIVAGDLAPGATAEGELSFMVPETARGLWFYLDTRWEGTAPLVVALQ